MTILSLLERCALKVREAVIPLMGETLASKPVGRGAGGDLTKIIDLKAEQAIMNELKEAGISCTIISEEAGIVRIGSSPDKFYVVTDPLDGTTNATHGIPFAATSIAVATKPFFSHLTAAVVLDLVHNVLYKAERGKGAYRNDERIRSSQNDDVVNSVLGVDVNIYKALNGKLREKLGRILSITKHPRYFGANALELCFVAAGVSDGFVDLRRKLRALDIAGGYLIAREAGAIITTPDGKEIEAEITPQTRIALVAAGNKKLHKKILEILNREK